jgi:hypothetical protein
MFTCVLVSPVASCPVLDEELHNVCMPIFSCPSQRPISASVHVRAVLDEELHHVWVAIL